MKMPIYILDIGDNGEMLINSMVDKPAHHHYFIAQSQKQYSFSIESEKREVVGVVIAANQPIYYILSNNTPCYVVFTKEIIKQIALDYFSKGRFNLIDINHDFNASESKAIMLETYFARKDNEFNVEEGSWIARYKIVDEGLWNDIKQGKIKGFSIAGNFELKEIELSNNQNSITMKLIEKLKNIIQSEIANSIIVETIDGKQMRIDGEFKEGSKIYAIATDGTEILAPQGEYLIKYDEKVYIVMVNEVGVITTLTVKEEEAQPSNEVQMQSVVAEMSKKVNEVEQKISEIYDALMSLAVELRDLKKFKKPEPVSKEEDTKMKFRIY